MSSHSLVFVSRKKILETTSLRDGHNMLPAKMSWSALFMTFIQRLGLKNMAQEQREGSDLVLNILISFFP